MFHVKPDAARRLPQIPQAQIDTLRAYEALLIDVAIPLGLVSASDRDRIWDRHIADSLRPLAVVGQEDLSFLDLGSGAGLPGLPIAIARPSSDVSLVEARGRKVSFLEMAVERLQLRNVDVILGRAESVGARADVCLARAFAGAADSWRVAEPLLEPGGVLVYWAGLSWSDADAELAAGAGARLEIAEPGSPGEHGPLVMMRREGSVPRTGATLGEEHDDGAGRGTTRP
jgi:16S rRNA (guanine527-N7)-methyltransferase